MKRIALATIIISMSLVGCNNSTRLNNQNQINGKVTIEEAKEIAIKHANLTSDQVSFIRTETDFDNGVEKYDIEFYHNNKEYDYEINASDGQIMKFDYDIEYNNYGQESNINSTAKISVEQAKEIALKHRNLGSNEVKFKKVELDFDNGIQKYEVEFYNNNREYSYEIDANTGAILSYDQE